MKPEAIAQSRERLQKAEAAVVRMRTAKNFYAAESAWLDFLLAASSVYSKLEKGTKGDGRSEAWFGRIKHERRTDELLSYIHHARNADEHGIERITERKPGYLAIKGDVMLNGSIGPGQRLHIQPINPTPEKPFSIEWQNPHIKLVPVVDDRFNDTFQPPKTHKSKSLENDSLQLVADLGLAYLRELVAAGAEFIPPLKR